MSSESERSPSSVRRALVSSAIRVLTLRAESTVSAAEGAAMAAASALARLARLEEEAASAKLEEEEPIMMTAEAAQSIRARAALLSRGRRGAILFKFLLLLWLKKRSRSRSGNAKEKRRFLFPCVFSRCFESLIANLTSQS